MALISVLGPAQAQAAAPDSFPIGSPVWEQARAIAQAHWGTVPCGGNVQFVWTPLEPLTNARATWHNPTDAWNNPAQNFDCRVDFNSGQTFDFPQFCTVMTHELGHLLGRPHDPTPGQLMSAIYSTPIPECANAVPAGSSAPAPVAPAPPAPATASRRPAADRSDDRRTSTYTSGKKRRAERVKVCSYRKSRKSGKRIKVCRTVLKSKTTRRCDYRKSRKSGKRIKVCRTVLKRTSSKKRCHYRTSKTSGKRIKVCRKVLRHKKTKRTARRASRH